jgi:hypothetical protein
MVEKRVERSIEWLAYDLIVALDPLLHLVGTGEAKVRSLQGRQQDLGREAQVSLGLLHGRHRVLLD